MVHSSIQKRDHTRCFSSYSRCKRLRVKIVITTGRPSAGVSALKRTPSDGSGDYVITFNGGLVQETATGKELIKDLFLHYEDYLDIEALLTNSKSTLPLQKTASIPAIAISDFTIHESQLVN